MARSSKPDGLAQDELMSFAADETTRSVDDGFEVARM